MTCIYPLHFASDSKQRDPCSQPGGNCLTLRGLSRQGNERWVRLNCFPAQLVMARFGQRMQLRELGGFVPGCLGDRPQRDIGSDSFWP